MLPGAGNYSELQLLSLPHRLATGKEENFVKQVVAIGQLLKIPVTKIRLQTVGTDHHCVTIQHLGKYLLDFYPAKLLAGHSSDNLAAFQKNIERLLEYVYQGEPITSCLQRFSGHFEQVHPLQNAQRRGNWLTKVSSTTMVLGASSK